MIVSVRAWILGALVVACAVTSVSAQESAAERWRSMDPEQRAELERRFEVFRGLDEDQRDALRERARSLKEEREGLFEALPEDERRRLEGLPPFERAEVLRDQLREVARRRGGGLREVMPPPILDRLEDAPPHDRPRILHRWRDSLHEQRLDDHLRRQVKRGGVAPELIEELLGLPRDERKSALRDLIGERVGRLSRHLPESVSEDQDLMRQLHQAAIPTVDELRSESPVDLAENARQRALGILRASGRVTPEELQQLEDLPVHKLLRAVGPPPFHGDPSHFGDGQRRGRFKPGQPEPGRIEPGRLGPDRPGFGPPGGDRSRGRQPRSGGDRPDRGRGDPLPGFRGGGDSKQGDHRRPRRG